MKMARSCLFLFGAAVFLAFLPASASGQGYSIEYRVFRGSTAAKSPASGPRVVTASFADPVLVQAYDPAAEPKAEADRVAVLKSELAAIYKLAGVEMVRANTIVWDGKKGSLSEVLLIDGDYFPISLSPRKLEDQRVSMAVEIRRYRAVVVSSRRSIAVSIGRGNDEEWMGRGKLAAAERFPGEQEMPMTGRDRPNEALFPVMSNPVGLASWDSIWGSGDRIADSEMTARIDETVVLGFPLGETAYFVSFRVGEPHEDKFWREVVDRVQRTERSWPSGLAVPPKPRFRLIPAFPEGSREAGVEGIVVLKVEVDPEGNPGKIEVVKGRSAALNRAAVEAMKQWRFEPVFVKGKAVGTTFFISFDFKLDQ